MKWQSLPFMPHAFKNVGKKTANLIVIFPTNVWKYDVLDFLPFKDSTKSVSKFEKFKNSLAKKINLSCNESIFSNQNRRTFGTVSV